MSLDWVTFELQRRVKQSYEEVRHMLSSPAVLGAGMTMPLDAEGILVMEAPFRPAPIGYEDALHAPAVLTSVRGRRIAMVRLEITAWSSEATALTLRPISSRPERWGARRMEQYFSLGHLGADAIARILDEEVAARSQSADH